MYISLGTRSDITNAVCYLSQFHHPNQTLSKAAKIILKYLNETKAAI